MKLNNDVFLSDIQEYIDAKSKELGFSSLSSTQRCLMLGEEVGELFKSIRKKQGITVDENSKIYEIEDELADVFLQTCAIANYFGIDLEKAFRNKQEKDAERWR